MAAAETYPVRVEASLDSPLSRWLWLVKWVLIIPHAAALAFLWLAFVVLSVVAFFAILFTGRYPRGIFEFNVGVLGMNRWVLRVAAYAGLMTDQYPPFRLDMGGHESGGTLTLPPYQPRQGPSLGVPPGGPPARLGPGPEGPPRAPVWTTGRIVSLVIGAVLALCSLGLFGAGGAAVWADTAQRNGGYVDLGTASYATAGHALASDTIRIHGWGWLSPLIGQIRIRVAQTGSASGVFAGVAPASAANRYLSGVAYTTVTGYNGHGQQVSHPGLKTPRPPGSTPIWAARTSGSRAAVLQWTVHTGDWTVIVMNADGSPGVSVRADVGASLPALGWLATELLAGGTVLALIALACIIIPVRMATVSADDPAASS